MKRERHEEIEEFEEEEELDEQNKNFCIQLDDKYRITADTHNYILQKLVANKNKPIWQAIYFFQEIPELLNDYTHQILRRGTVRTLEQYITKADNITKRLENLCRVNAGEICKKALKEWN